MLLDEQKTFRALLQLQLIDAECALGTHLATQSWRLTLPLVQENWKLSREPEPNSYLGVFHACGTLRGAKGPRILNPGSYIRFGGYMKIPQLCCLAYTFVQQENVFLILDMNLQPLQVFSTWASE